MEQQDQTNAETSVKLDPHPASVTPPEETDNSSITPLVSDEKPISSSSPCSEEQKDVIDLDSHTDEKDEADASLVSHLFAFLINVVQFQCRVTETS